MTAPRSRARAAPAPSRPRVLLADDHPLVLAGLQRLIEADCDVVGAVGDGRALVAAARRLRPDIILLDIAMPGTSGFEAARALRKTAPEARVVFLTMYASPALAAEAVKLGAWGYVLKSGPSAEVGRAIRAVLEGRRYFTPLVGDAMRRAADRPPKELSARQKVVLRLVAEGRTGKEIANELRISIRTVEYHKARFARELGLGTTAEIVRYAIAHGLIFP